MSEIKVEIGQYREINKGSLKAFFSVVIYPMGQKILDCRYFVMDDKRWFSFPQKEVKYSDGRKSEYIPYVSYLNKDYLEKLREQILLLLKDAKPLENHEKKNNQLPKDAQEKISSKPQDLWF